MDNAKARLGDEEMKDETRMSIDANKLKKANTLNLMEADDRQHEAAGKKSTTTQGGLARLLFGKG